MHGQQDTDYHYYKQYQSKSSSNSSFIYHDRHNKSQLAMNNNIQASQRAQQQQQRRPLPRPLSNNFISAHANAAIPGELRLVRLPLRKSESSTSHLASSAATAATSECALSCEHSHVRTAGKYLIRYPLPANRQDAPLSTMTSSTGSANDYDEIESSAYDYDSLSYAEMEDEGDISSEASSSVSSNPASSFTRLNYIQPPPLPQTSIPKASINHKAHRSSLLGFERIASTLARLRLKTHTHSSATSKPQRSQLNASFNAPQSSTGNISSGYESSSQSPPDSTHNSFCHTGELPMPRKQQHTSSSNIVKSSTCTSISSLCSSNNNNRAIRRTSDQLRTTATTLAANRSSKADSGFFTASNSIASRLLDTSNTSYGSSSCSDATSSSASSSDAYCIFSSPYMSPSLSNSSYSSSSSSSRFSSDAHVSATTTTAEFSPFPRVATCQIAQVKQIANTSAASFSTRKYQPPSPLYENLPAIGKTYIYDHNQPAHHQHKQHQQHLSTCVNRRTSLNASGNNKNYSINDVLCSLKAIEVALHQQTSAQVHASPAKASGLRRSTSGRVATSTTVNVGQRQQESDWLCDQEVQKILNVSASAASQQPFSATQHKYNQKPIVQWEQLV